MKIKNQIILSIAATLLFACSEEVNPENQTQDTASENVVENPPLEMISKRTQFIQSLDIDNHQTPVDPELHSPFKFALDAELIKKLQLKEIFQEDFEIYALSIPQETSANYITLNIGTENTCCFIKNYLVNYSLDGKFIDKLLITEGDYIEGLTHLESKIQDHKIKRTLYKANYDVEPARDDPWKQDEFNIDEQGYFQGEDLIYKEDQNTSATTNENFVGQWTKEDINNPIDPNAIKIEINEDQDYIITFGGEDFTYIATKEGNKLTGNGAFGHFVLEMSTATPGVLNYSDDGRGGHFEPNKNIRFIKN